MKSKVTLESSELFAVIVVLSMVSACTNTIDSKATQSISDQAVDTIVTAIEGTTDSNGVPTSLRGYTATMLVANSAGVVEGASIYTQSNTPLFEFSTPAGTEVSFSPPNSIGGSSLTSSRAKDLCANLSFGNAVPTVGDLLELGKVLPCGTVEYSVCMRLTASQGIRYTMTPAKKVDFACPEVTFAALAFSAAKISSTSASLSISAGAAVQSMYISNQEFCQFGGSWETVATGKASWSLANSSQHKVYAIFRDYLGRESSCLAASLSVSTTSNTGATNASSSSNGTTSTTGASPITTGSGGTSTTTTSSGTTSATGASSATTSDSSSGSIGKFDQSKFDQSNYD